jgi:uncharacterized membrane protein
VGLVAVEQGLILTQDRDLREDADTSVASDRRVRLFVYTATVAYALLFSAAAAVSYFAFIQKRFDLGNMTQAVWATAHGHPLRVTTEAGTEISRLGGHVDPFLVLLVPFWWLWSSPLMLLVVQAIAVSAGSIPVYWLARKHLRSSRLAASYSVAYLLYPATQFNTFTPVGMHPVSFAIPLILFAIWFLDEERLILFAVFALVAASTKEEIPAAIGCLGIWFAVRKGRVLLGASIFAVGFGVTVANILVVIPHFAQGGVSPFAGRYEDVGGTPGGMLHTALTDPIAFVDAIVTWHKLLFVVLLLLPFLGLWLFEPLILIGAVPDLVINLLSSKPEQTTIFYQYTAGIVPFVIAASVLGTARLKRDPRRISRCVLVIVACTAIVSPLFYSAYNLELARPSNPTHAAIRHALSLVPPGVPISASQTLGGYLSTRRYVAVFPSLGRAEWVLVGRPAAGYDDPHVLKTSLARLKSSSLWKLVYESNGISVLHRRR